MEKNPGTPSPLIEIFEIPPSHFIPKMEVAGCFMYYHDRLLLLKRHPSKPQPNTWCVPGGKVENNESLEKGIVREVYEETGFLMNSSPRLIGTIYVRYPEIDFIYHMFEYYINEPSITIKMSIEEHSEFCWATMEEALHLPLIPGGKECFLMFQKSRKTQMGTMNLTIGTEDSRPFYP